MTADDAAEILALAEALTAHQDRLASRQCQCEMRRAQGKPVPCANCRVAAFRTMNSQDYGDDATWSPDISTRQGVADAF